MRDTCVHIGGCHVDIIGTRISLMEFVSLNLCRNKVDKKSVEAEARWRQCWLWWWWTSRWS
jgi:hypothetical protein